MTKEEFKDLFKIQIDDWNRRIKLSDYFDHIAAVPIMLHFIIINEYSLENVTMEMKSISGQNIDDFDCSNLELFKSDHIVNSPIPQLIEIK